MMRLWNAFVLAATELRRNWTRTLLTSLGILIGVAAVITMVGLGRGATASIEADLSSMGSNLLLVSSGTGGGPHARRDAPPFDASDVRAIREQVPHAAAVTPVVSTSATAVAAGLEWDTRVTGATSDYLIASRWTLGSGRAFTEGEERAGNAVCVIGQTVVDELYAGLDPLGSDLRVDTVSCTVIGTLEAKGENTMGDDQDNLVLLPVNLVQRRIVGSTGISNIQVSIDESRNMDVAAGTLEALLRERRHITSDDAMDFEVRDTREMAERVGGVTTLLTAFLSAVAGISLLVGGIGIMNIMLVSVTERTREIGIRLSIGALEGDVMTQFLVEAVVLAAFGGFVGVVLGTFFTFLGSFFLDVPFVIEPLAVAGALLFSAGIGVVFGWWPARRAARLEPIDALRHT